MATPVPKNTRATSFRVDPDVWEQARIRAEGEGRRVTSIVAELVEGYALGHYDLPERRFPPKKTYPTQA